MVHDVDGVSRRSLLAAAAAGLASTAAKEERYRHVVVGGGSAGCVLARRLSEDAGRSVLLIEAGGARQPPAVDIPAQWIGLSSTELNWGFATAPQPHSDDRVLPLARGKTLGGSSVINAMIHHRGVPGDYDRWTALGAAGWDAQAMQPAFVRSEAWLGAPDPRRGRDGPVVVHPVDQPTPAALRFMDGAQRAGHRLRPDLNAEPGAGVSLNQVAFDGVHRMSTYRAYLVPALTRPNLKVVTDAQVTRLVFARSRCTGVRYLKEGEERFASVDGEVILSAGSIQSPQILMLSGIGPQEQLARHGIKTLVHAPGVGAGLHEHLIFPGVSIETRAPFPPSRLMGTDAVLYARSGLTSGERDLMFNFAGFATFGPGMESVAAGCKASSSFLKPTSRGRVTLAGPDPLTAPRIDPNVLSDPGDVTASIRGLEIAREILNGPAFADVRLREVNPGPKTATVADLRSYLRRTGILFGHSVGTCRMGADDAAVVDPQLRVRGIDNLRVVDASVIPEIPAAPTNATVIAIAERASGMLATKRA